MSCAWNQSPDAVARENQSRMQRFSSEQHLRPWDEVAAIWNRMSGQRISRNRVWQIARRAEEKIRAALHGEG